MKTQIQSFSGHQTSKVLALLFALLTLPFSLIGIFGFISSPTMDSGNGEEIVNFPFLMFAFAPVFYGLMGYFFNRLGCFAYNFVAKRVGGIEFTTVEQNES